MIITPAQFYTIASTFSRRGVDLNPVELQEGVDGVVLATQGEHAIMVNERGTHAGAHVSPGRVLVFRAQGPDQLLGEVESWLDGVHRGRVQP